MVHNAMPPSPAAICSCGDRTRGIFNPCTTCSKAGRRRSQRISPKQSTHELTPPPSQPGSPQRMSSDVPSLSDIPASRRPSEVVVAIDQAFVVDEDSEDDEPGSSTLIPKSCYRTPARTSSGSNAPRRKASSSSVPPSGRMPRIPRGSEDSIRTSGSVTPEIRSPPAGYSPMAAGFARLSLDGDRPSEQTRMKSARATFALEAKMFSGPA